MQLCPNCRELVQEDWIVCPKCAVVLEGMTPLHGLILDKDDPNFIESNDNPESFQQNESRGIWLQHLAIFIPMNILLAAIDALPDGETSWSFWVHVCWGSAMLLHTVVIILQRRR